MQEQIMLRMIVKLKEKCGNLQTEVFELQSNLEMASMELAQYKEQEEGKKESEDSEGE